MTQVAESDGRDYYRKGYACGFDEGLEAARYSRSRYFVGLLHGAFLAAIAIYFYA